MIWSAATRRRFALAPKQVLKLAANLTFGQSGDESPHSKLIDGPVGIQHFHVIRALERGGLRAMLLAHAANHLRD